MLVIGLPAGISSMLYNITNVYVQKAINMLGTDTVAAWSVFWKLDGIFWPINNAIGIAVMTFAGQNYGARKKDRIFETMRVGFLLHFAMCALIGGGIFLTRDWTIRLFNSDPAVVEQGRVIIGYLAPCYILFSATEVLSSMMRGVGNAVKPTIITLFGACVLRLILLFTMTFPHLSNLTIALCYPITWTAAVGNVPHLLQIRPLAPRVSYQARGDRLTQNRGAAKLQLRGYSCVSSSSTVSSCPRSRQTSFTVRMISRLTACE